MIQGWRKKDKASHGRFSLSHTGGHIWWNDRFEQLHSYKKKFTVLLLHPWPGVKNLPLRSEAHVLQLTTNNYRDVDQ